MRWTACLQFFCCIEILHKKTKKQIIELVFHSPPVLLTRILISPSFTHSHRKCPVLSCPVLSCPVLSCLVLSIMPLAALAHPRQSHRDLSRRCPPERQRTLSAPTRQSLCASVPLAQPSFGSVNPLLFSPLLCLSLSRGTRRGSPPVHPP